MSDLTKQEQENVRKALRFLWAKMGGWKPVAKALRVHDANLSVRSRTISASLAFRVARFAGVGVDEVLEGRFPGEGVCPYCGHDAGSISQPR